MKIIRLTTTHPEAIFDNTILGDLTLRPNSRIALQSLTLEQDDEFLVINDTNDTFQWSSQVNQSATITFPHQIVSFQNFNDFLEQFTRLLNNSIDYDINNPYNSLLAMEWRVDTLQDQKIVIEHKKGAVNEHVDMWEKGANVDRQGADNLWGIYANPPVADLDGYAFNLLSPKEVVRGNGFIRCQVYKALFNAAGNQKQGFTIGLSTTNLGEVQPANFTENMVTYAVNLTITADGVGDYRIQKQGVFTDTGANLGYTAEGSNENDFVEVMKNGTQIVFNLYDKNATTQYLIETGIESDVELYPFIVFHQEQSYFKINKLRCTISPFADLTDFEDADKEDQSFEEIRSAAPPMPTPGRTANSINFVTESLAEFLGYNNLREPRIGTTLARNIQYVADKIFKPRFFVQSMIIEMLNMKLDSYDGFPGAEKRKSILAFIPTSNQDRITVYEQNQNFIDLRNEHPILLRNIQARIVQGDYSPINLIGQASMVILVED